MDTRPSPKSAPIDPGRSDPAFRFVDRNAYVRIASSRDGALRRLPVTGFAALPGPESDPMRPLAAALRGRGPPWCMEGLQGLSESAKQAGKAANARPFAAQGVG